MKNDHLAGSNHTSAHNHSTGNNLETDSGQISSQRNSKQMIADQIPPEESRQGWKEGTYI